MNAVIFYVCKEDLNQKVEPNSRLGFNQRIIELHCSPGFPKYDISEVINPAGEEEH